MIWLAWSVAALVVAIGLALRPLDPQPPTDTAMTTPHELYPAAVAYGRAFALNLDPKRSGAPCRAAFRAARLLLEAELGEELATRVDDLVNDDQCTADDLARLAAEARAELLEDARGD